MVSSAVSEILEQLRKERPSFTALGPTVSVNSLTSRAGAMYEKIRYLVDYKDEHTIRRSAVERILKRKLSLEGEQNVGMSLLRELVSAEYLPNSQVPETMAATIQAIVDKYRLLYANTEKRWPWEQTNKAQPAKSESVIMSLAASEIDRMLFPQELDDATVESFYKMVKGKIRCVPPMHEEDFRAPLYIACRRTLLRDDTPTLLYAIVSKYVPELSSLSGSEKTKALVPRFRKALADAHRQIDDPMVFRIAASIRNYALGFSIIREIIKKHGIDAEDIFEEPERLDVETKKILAEKYIRQNHSVWVSGAHAAMYIVLTKSIFTFLLEVPYELYLYQRVDMFALGVNIIFHPILLLLMVYTIQPLDSKNMTRTLAEVREILYGEDNRMVHIRSSNHKPIIIFISSALYAVLFAGTFGAIIKTLLFIRFSVASIVLFLFFLALVSYFGLRIRHNAMRWKISVPNKNTASLLWNFFTIPIIRAGRWLAQKFAAVNIFVFVMDFIIEMPFKIILGTFDSFLSFLKEKEEDMY
jgi:hypothetical protein